MTRGSSVKSIAACFGFAAFAVAIISGLAAGRTLQEILGGAIASLFVCFIVGSVVGLVGERTVQEAASRYTTTGEDDDRQEQSDEPPAARSPA